MENVRPGEIRLVSRLKSTFDTDLLVDLETVSMDYSLDNNTKINIMTNMMLNAGVKISPLGGGTNRYGFLCGEYCFKIALDVDGKTDNKREFMYSKQLQPYVIKCYEIYKNGFIAVFEYVSVFSSVDYGLKRSEMRAILNVISESFLIGDMGVGPKNYANWGYRLTGDRDIVILDFAYIYNLAVSVFRCKCGTILVYNDDDYNYLKCPKADCGKVYSFWDVRKRVPKEMEQKEIGDITEKGYVISSPEEIVKINPKFTEIENLVEREEDDMPEEFKKSETTKFTLRDIPSEKQPKSVEESIQQMLSILEMEEKKNEQEKEKEIRL